MTTPETRTTKRCPQEPSIGAIMSDDNFCWHCGAALETVTLPNCPCGHRLSESDHFCPKCGTPRPEPTPMTAEATARAATIPADDCPF